MNIIKKTAIKTQIHGDVVDIITTDHDYAPIELWIIETGTKGETAFAFLTRNEAAMIYNALGEHLKDIN